MNASPVTPSRSKLSLDAVLDWFIPPDLAGERETRQRARMFLISHLFGPVIGNSIPILLYLLEPQAGMAVQVLAVSITAFWAFPFILRLTGRYNLLAILSVQNLLFAVLWGCYFYGGVSSPFLPWLLTVPLLAFFYLGPSVAPRVIVLCMIMGNLAGFYALSIYGNPPPSELPALIGIVSTLASAVYVSMMALYYAKILASGVELEGEMKGHMATAAELRRATLEAERAGVAKAEFLAKMSHELRTPLNAVIGYSQILLEDASDEGDTETAADLEKIHGAGHHLLRLVNEVLDLSKIEAGKMELSPEAVDAGSFLQETVDNHRDAAVKNGNSLSLVIEQPLGTIVCDVMKAQQALGQVLDNAAKFTRDGEITVTASRRPSAAGEEIVIAVRDTGIGIAEETIPSLFEKFSVADDTSTSKYGGTGLGLTLSLKLCRLMGGDVSAESELGVGSCFTILLPTAPPAASDAHKLEEAAQEHEAAVAA